MTANDVLHETAGILDKLFANRKDTYALQQKNGAYYRIDEPISTEVIKKHLTGEHTIGVYQLNHDEMVKWLCIDIDEHFTKNITLKSFIEPSPLLKDTVERLLARFRHYELSVNLEFSGRRGYHIWGFINQPMSAIQVQTVCAGIIKEAIEELHNSVTIELFPKQAYLTEQNSFGNLVKLPLGIHRVMNQRSYFCDEKFNPHRDNLGKMLLAQTNHLKHIRRIESVKLQELIQEFEEPVFSNPDLFSGISASDTEFLEKPAAVIFKNCSKIRELWEKAESTGMLSYEERRNIASIFAHIPGGDEVIHKLWSHCNGYQDKGDYNEKTTQKHIDKIRRHMKPVTCAQLCGCDNIKQRGMGGSPVAFGCARHQTANLVFDNLEEDHGMGR